MSITLSEFRIRFPEFASISDDVINLQITDSELMLNTSFWGDKYNLGQAYLVAHFVKITQAESTDDPDVGKVIASKSVDGVSVSFDSLNSNVSLGDSFYLSTSYGKRYLQLRRSLGIAAYNV